MNHHIFRKLTLTLALALIALIPAAPVSAALAWTARTSQATFNLNDVAANGNTVIAVGDNGIIRRSTDAGVTWSSIVSGVSNQLRAVDFAADGSGALVAVGSFGTYLSSSDNGVTWTSKNIGTAETLESVAVRTGQSIAVGGWNGAFYTSSDSGQTWTKRELNTTRKITALDSVQGSNTILAFLENGVPMHSEDLGATWAEGTLSGSDDMLSLKMITSSVALGAGLSGRVILTTNGGVTWTNVTTPASVATVAFHSMAVNNNNFYSVAGTEGTIITTTDGGGTWTIEPTGTTDHFFGITNINLSTTKMVAVGQSGKIITSEIAPTTGPSAPTNLAVSGVSANSNYSTNNATPTLSWTAAVKGSADVSNYQVKIDSGSFASVGNVTQYTLPSLTNGLHTVRVKAVDTAGAMSDEAVKSFTVDTVAPTVNAPTPTTASVGASVVFTVSTSDNTNGSYVNFCRLYVNGAEQGLMNLKNAQQGTYSHSYYFATAGTFAMTARCTDNAGNVGSSAATNINLTVGGGTQPTDTTPSAAMSYIISSPTTGVANGTSNVLVTVVVRNAAGATLANKSVNLVTSRPQADTIVAIATVTNDAGQAQFYVRSNALGTSQLTAVVNSSSVASVGLVFAEQSSTVLVGQPTPGSLIKLACPPNADVNHICRAVYFVSEGKRHAFSNAKVYFSWYPDFSAVQTVSAETMASLMLGKNIVYHPGVRMVKFITNPKVYAVGKGGLLRGITSEAVAKALYGTTWNKKIDDVSDAFAGDYVFGLDVASASDYSPLSEAAAVPTPLYN